MDNTQSKRNISVPVIPRISVFDKKGQTDLSRFTTGPKINTNRGNVNVPQFRINQHKGA